MGWGEKPSQKTLQNTICIIVTQPHSLCPPLPPPPPICLLQQSKEEKCHVHAPHSHFSHFTPRFMFWIKINCVSVIYRYISIYIYMYFFNTMALSSTQLNRVQKRKNKEREKLNK